MSRADEPALEQPGAAGQRRVMARAARATFRALRRTPVGLFTEQAWFVRLRTRIIAAGVDDVLAVLEALDGVGARAWLVGGWGIDALLGTVTRRHSDIDVLVSADPTGHERALAALAALGYTPVPDSGPAGHWLPVRSVLRDRDGRAIEYLSVRAEVDGVTPPGPPGAPAITASEQGHGYLGGRRVPCASPTMQLRLHTGYAPKRQDRVDVTRLVARFDLDSPPEYAHDHTGDGSPTARVRAAAGRVARRAVRAVRPPARETAVVVPVPAAAAVTSLPGAEPGEIPAHVTVLYPFVPARKLTPAHVESLRRIAADAEPFAVSFAETGRFPGVLYLRPDDEARRRFVALTGAVAEAWPAYPPYGGRYADVVPHTTVYLGEREPPGLEAAVTAALPVAGTATEAWLVAQDDAGHWVVRERLPFGR